MKTNEVEESNMFKRSMSRNINNLVSARMLSAFRNSLGGGGINRTSKKNTNDSTDESPALGDSYLFDLNSSSTTLESKVLTKPAAKSEISQFQEISKRTLKKLISLLVITTIMVLLSSKESFIKEDLGYFDDIKLLLNLKISPEQTRFIKTIQKRYEEISTPLMSVKINGIYLYRYNRHIEENSRTEYKTIHYSSLNSTIEMKFDESYRLRLGLLCSFSESLFYAVVITGFYFIILLHLNKEILAPIRSLIKLHESLICSPTNPDFNRVFIGEKCSEFRQHQFELNLVADQISKLVIWECLAFGRECPQFFDLDCLRNSTDYFRQDTNLQLCQIAVVDLGRTFEDLSSVKNGKILINKIHEIIQSISSRYLGFAQQIDLSKFVIVWNTMEDSKAFTKTLSFFTMIKIMVKLHEFQEEHIHLSIRPLDNFRSIITKGDCFLALVGTYLKGDLRFLGSGIEVAKKLLTISKNCQIPILVESSVYLGFPEILKAACRKIDIIKPTLDSPPLEIYIVDVNMTEIPREENYECFPFERTKRLIHSTFRRMIINKIETGVESSSVLLDRETFQLLKIKSRLRKMFKSAVVFYELGVWKPAADLLNKCLEIEPLDGPSLRLLDYIARHNYNHPNNWRGFRVLEIV